MVMVDCNASKSDQWLLDWFKTQTFTTRKNKSTIIFEMCQIKKKWHSPIRFDNILFNYSKQ
jgi:hypothetical protein